MSSLIGIPPNRGGGGGNSGAGPTPAGAANAVIDGDDAGFAREVLEASRNRPVVVDFWATWCGPCKQLGPVLEKAVRATRGAVKLVKIDIDKHPVIAGQLGVQSIPAVFAFFGGRPVDGFMGALPESRINEFLAKLLRTAGADDAAGDDPLQQALQHAGELSAAGDLKGAEALYKRILQHEPGHVAAVVGLARCRLQAGRADQARAALNDLPEAERSRGEAAALTATIELAEDAADIVPRLKDLQTAVEKDPADHAARFDLARGLFAVARPEGAMEHLLELLRRNRDWNDGAARLKLLRFFDALGGNHPLTVAGRRKLSSLLFS